MFDVSFLWDAIYGNCALKKLLLSEITSGKLAHAYILEGVENSGKLTLARTIACSMANTMADVKKIQVGASPDVIELDLPEGRKSIGVDAVRGIKMAAHIRPNDLDCKFFLINHAEMLTKEAQNALLKLLEEPPKGVYILLLCTNVSALLPTIRSRAPVLRMQSFSADELTELLLRYSADAQRLYEKDRATLEVVVRSSGGAYGEALRRIANVEIKSGDPVYTVIDILDLICERNRAALLKKLWSLPPERESFRQALFLFRLAVRDIIAYRATRGDCEYLFPQSEKTPYFAGKLSLDRLLKIHDAVASLEKDARYNPNVLSAKSLLYTKLCAV